MNGKHNEGPGRESALELADFKSLIALHGATQERWPNEVRNRAKLLLRSNIEAQRLLAEAAKLDSMLDDLPEPAPASEAFVAEAIRSVSTSLPETGAARRQSIFQKLQEQLGELDKYFRPQILLPQGAACATFFAVGLMLGAGEPASAIEHDVSDWIFPEYDAALDPDGNELEEGLL